MRYLSRRKSSRLLLLGLSLICLWFYASSTSKKTRNQTIKQQNILELVTGSDKSLDPRRHDFLQARIGRDERPDLLDTVVLDGMIDYWERYQKPFIVGHETMHMDAQSTLSAIEQLLSLNGWVAAACPTLQRPFGQNSNENVWDELIRSRHLYFIGISIHSADHFLVDQLAVIVQMARRLGPQRIFVSMLDYGSTDSTDTLLDLCEAVLTLLNVPFRIKRVAPMTEDPSAAHYPMEEAFMRNLALEPLHELYTKRKTKFHRVIWLKGFTCPNDLVENIKVSQANNAAMVCGMDWAELNGFFIFSDRWRTRDINGDQFRQSKSSASPGAGPPRDRVGSARYAQHLPFQVFCCESGTHVVDPAQSYYRGLQYRSGLDFHNLSTNDPLPERGPNAPCLDSTQAWFCRDLWVEAAREAVRSEDKGAKKPSVNIPLVDVKEPNLHPRQLLPQAANEEEDDDQDVGSDFDAMPDADTPPEAAPSTRLTVLNTSFRPARIMVNPRCVTTYAGVSHTQLAMDLFGPDQESELSETTKRKYVLDEWVGAPSSFVCQEQRQTGGRSAQKTQRRLGFSIYDAMTNLIDNV